MTTLHVFNPEHDLALASSLPMFTPPHAARQLRFDLGFLPALWAAEGDMVLVDDMEQATRGYQLYAGYALRRRRALPHPPHFVTERDLRQLHIDNIDVWGWDAPVCHRLMRAGVSDRLLPSPDTLFEISLLSHRRTSMQLLQSLRNCLGNAVTGQAREFRSIDELRSAATDHIVIKAPWSSSGRGVRFVTQDISVQTLGWLQHVIERQGSVMVEPLYERLCDFGMEFHSDGQGHTEYHGLSLFHTANGAYTGNLLATETRKRLLLGQLIAPQLLLDVRQAICQLTGQMFCGRYAGPFGIDMMVVRPRNASADNQCLLHPCVELNLRRTMGHVALALTPDDDGVTQVMRITPPGEHYRLVIQPLDEGKHVKTL
ncbi:MAG: hypothetical protein K5928_00900 [Prevotella sp.]|nr:hypothetical protein [Prevotella sp.]